MGNTQNTRTKGDLSTMKTMTRVVAVALVAVMMCMMLASCGNTLNGKYSAETLNGTVSYDYEFSGKNVTLKITTPSLVGALLGSGSENIRLQEGTYEIKDDMITFTWESNSGEGAVEVGAGPYSYASGDGFIMIDGIKLDKQK